MTILELLDRYQPFDAEESAMAERLQRFLRDAKDGAFARDLAGEAPEWGHVTGSAWVVNSEGSRVIMLHHAKLNLWVQPGGHCDGECKVLAVAMREAQEETGLKVEAVSEEIFDIDVHLIPEYWNTPAHWHFDVRFLLRADSESTPVASNESRAVRWVSLDEAAALNGEASVSRMIEKTRRLSQATAAPANFAAARPRL